MTWLLIALVGGFVGLDSNSFAQIMISRPLIAGCLTGIVFGRPLEGTLVGGVLEVFALVILPIGAARYPEAGTGAVAATAAYLSATDSGIAPGMLLLAIAFGLVWEWVGSASVTAVRRVNEVLVADAEFVQHVDPGTLQRRHLTAMLIDFVRGSLVCVAGGVGGWGLLRSLGPYWAMGPAPAFGVLAICSTAAIAALLPLFGGWSQQKFAFTLGALCGSLLLLLR
jgi:mannose/fructose/N-acetylgalactosamine-specific phosphotransferase system component IIC